MEHKEDQYLKEIYFNRYRDYNLKELQGKANQTKRVIIDVLANYKKVCFGYSAGKYSILLHQLLRETPSKYDSVLWQTRFQFPLNQLWIASHCPENLIIEDIARPDWDDLEVNSDLLFTGTKQADVAYMQHKWRAQNVFLKRYGYDLFITGRRLAESNNCGAKAKQYIRKGKSYDVFSPLAQWKTEEVFAYMGYKQIELPWQMINTPNGFTHNRARGTHLLEPMKAIIKELLDAGKTTKEICKELGMRPEEVFRLSDFSRDDFLRIMNKGNPNYSKAYYIKQV